jgi:single stranded DNA-binding protein
MKLAVLVGNLGKKPVVKSSNGTSYCNFTIAVNQKGRDGEQVTEWYPIVAFQRLAEALTHVEVGDELLVDGTFHQISYAGRDGVLHRDVEIRARTIKFLRRKDRGRPDPPDSAAVDEAAAPDTYVPSGPDRPADDISEDAAAAPNDPAPLADRKTRTR